MFLIAGNKEESTDPIKTTSLLNLIGDEGVDIFNTFKALRSWLMFYKHLISFATQKKNVVSWGIQDSNVQSLSHYITKVKSLLTNCEYEAEDDMLRDKIIMRIRDDYLKEKSLQTEHLSLKETIDICQVTENSRKKTDEMADAAFKTIEVDGVQGTKKITHHTINENFSD